MEKKTLACERTMSGRARYPLRGSIRSAPTQAFSGMSAYQSG